MATTDEKTKKNFRKHMMFRGQIGYDVNECAKTEGRSFSNMATELLNRAMKQIKDEANHE